MSNFTLFFPFITILPLLLLCSTISCMAQSNNSVCAPSSCGNITITYPFRLTTDPPHCGYRDPIFALQCRQNRTTLRLETRRYRVQTITYANFSLRLSDPGLDTQNYSSCPIYSSWDINDLYSSYMYSLGSTYSITFLNCLKPVNNNPLYVRNPFCGNTSGAASYSPSRVYSYVTVGRISVSDLEEVCTYDMTVGTAWRSGLMMDTGERNYTYSEIHDMMAYGFEMSWFRVYCSESCSERNGDCVLEDDKVRCRYSCYEIVSLPQDSFGCTLVYYGLYSIYGAMAIGGIMALKFALGIPFLIGLIVYKYKTRHSSMQESETIEEISHHHVNFMPINYTYGEIKKMTNNFKSKLGSNVFKGNLQTGPSVAVKTLINSSASDKEFISHVSKLSRTSHHPNILKLIGFCIKGTERVLVHEFMHNGSLEKHVFSQERMNPTLRCEDMFKIALGIARGVDFLHGFEILDLGIESRNVLLDEEFKPKVSDCGLRKFYSSRNYNKMGFIAPEIFYENIGEISSKADVYSFGMVVLEMLARIEYGENIGQIYFPFWIYKHLRQGKELEIMDANEEEKMMVKKMILVGLWCIQIRPVDRPLMSEVVSMLEGGIEMLEMPPMPFQRAMDDDDDDDDEMMGNVSRICSQNY
ncbi:hypothetical protein OROHE_025140 [Orobanche hederae]